jgi:hypothetical protein
VIPLSITKTTTTTSQAPLDALEAGTHTLPLPWKAGDIKETSLTLRLLKKAGYNSLLLPATCKMIRDESVSCNRAASSARREVRFPGH